MYHQRLVLRTSSYVSMQVHLTAPSISTNDILPYMLPWVSTTSYMLAPKFLYNATPFYMTLVLQWGIICTLHFVLDILLYDTKTWLHYVFSCYDMISNPLCILMIIIVMLCIHHHGFAVYLISGHALSYEHGYACLRC